MLRQSHTHTKHYRATTNLYTTRKKKSAILNETSETEDPKNIEYNLFPPRISHMHANVHFIFTLIFFVHLLQLPLFLGSTSLARGAYHTRVYNVNGFIFFFVHQFFGMAFARAQIHSSRFFLLFFLNDMKLL